MLSDEISVNMSELSEEERLRDKQVVKEEAQILKELVLGRMSVETRIT